MKKIPVFLTILFFFNSIALAVEPASDSALTEKIKERLEQTASQDLSAIKEEIAQTAKSPRAKAYIGSIKTIDGQIITLSYKNQEFAVDASKAYEIMKTSGQKKLALKDLKNNDFLIVMGLAYPGKNELEARKINLIPAPEVNDTRQLIIGKIEEIDGNKIKVNGKTLTISSKTRLEIKGLKSPNQENLELKDTLFAIVSLDKNGTIIETKNIFVIPGENNTAGQEPTNAQTSTSSADASESATIKADD